MAKDKVFDCIASWVLKCINSHFYWTPNPFTVILHSSREIFREYAAEHFKVMPLELEDAKSSFYKALREKTAAYQQREYKIRYCTLIHSVKWHQRKWLKRHYSKWYINRMRR